MNRIKVAYLSLAVATATAIPLISVVSCSTSNSNSIQSNRDVDLSIDKLITFSKNKQNVVLFFADEVTGKLIYDYLKQDPDNLAKDLSGATIYKNVIVNGTATNMGVPQIYGGPDYSVFEKNLGIFKDDTVEEFNKKAYRNTLSMFHDQGFDQQYYQVQYFGHESGESWWQSNSDEFERENETYNAKSASSWDVLEKFGNRKGMSSNDVDFYAMKSIAENIKFKNTEKPMFKSFVTESAHSGYLYWNDKSRKLETGNSDLASFSALKQIINIIKKIKSQGIYDNTMFVIASDHGSNQLPNPLTKTYNNDWGGLIRKFQANASKYIGGTNLPRINPMLIVKPFSAKGKLIFNNTSQLANFDIPQIFANEINSNYFERNSKSKHFIKNPLENKKEREFEVQMASYNYYRFFNKKKYDDTQPNKLKVVGNMWDIKNWYHSKFNEDKWTKIWK